MKPDWGAFVQAVARSAEEAREFWLSITDFWRGMNGARKYFQKCVDEKMDELEAAYKKYADQCRTDALTVEEKQQAFITWVLKQREEESEKTD